MGDVEKVDRTLPLKQMDLLTAGHAEVPGYAPTPAWRTGTGIVAWPRLA
jgi:hypothetical protein